MRAIVTDWETSAWRIVYFAGENFSLVIHMAKSDHEPSDADIFAWFPEKYLKDYGVYKVRALGPTREHEYRLELVDDGKSCTTLEVL